MSNRRSGFSGPRTRIQGAWEGGTAECRLSHAFKSQYGNEYVTYAPYIYSYDRPSQLVRTDDVVTPQFRRRSSAGEIINNPFRKSVSETFPLGPVPTSLILLINDQSGEWGTKLAGLSVPFYGYTAPGLLGSRMEDWNRLNAAVDAAVTQAHARINPEELLLGATLGEARETCDFFLDTARRFIRIGRNVRRLNLRRLRRQISFRDFQDRYMEYRYAVRPVIQDMVSVCKAVTATRGTMRQTSRGHSEFEQSYEDVMTDRQVHPGLMVDVHRKFKMTVSVRAGVLCNVEKTYSSVFGLSKLPETAWELLPFSFMADWVANIGDTIAAHQPRMGVSELASWVTLRYTTEAFNETGNLRLIPGAYSNYTSVNYSYGMCRWGTRETVIERRPNPNLRAWPQVDVNLDALRLLDTGIILRNLFR